MKFKNDSLYLNRGLSWLEFNQRVLDQAFDLENPLLERLKFLGIVSSNLDEFFEVHVAAIKQQCQHGGNKPLPDGFLPEEELNIISARIRKQLVEQYQCWKEIITPALEKEKITFHQYSHLPAQEQHYFKKYFEEFISPMLTPLAVDPSHPFPHLPNLSLNVLVALQSTEEGEMSTDLAVVPIPAALPRLVPFPNQSQSKEYNFVFLESIVKYHVGALFYGVEAISAHLFRITRNSNLTIDEEEPDLLHAIEEELRHLHCHTPIRLEVDQSCPEWLFNRLLKLLSLHENDLYILPDTLALKQLLPLAFEIDRPDLREECFIPHRVLSLNEETDVFWHLRKEDILLHHPYDSFQTVLDFLEYAAKDPSTLAIKQTLYRTSHDSPLVASLITAAQNGKQVTVIIELKARFDEAANIKWARMMRDAGVNVIYGMAGLKTHAKALLVVRQEGEVIRRYAHLSTGNYHPTTASLYTDLGLLTADKRITDDVAAMFNMLTGVSHFPQNLYSQSIDTPNNSVSPVLTSSSVSLYPAELHDSAPCSSLVSAALNRGAKLQTLMLAPYNLKEKLFQLLDRESEHARAGRPSGVMIKMNALVEKSMIEALYHASQAGVKIRLLIRGTCCLRPGIAGLSDNIEVRSIVGRFLEHSRILRFENGGNPEIFLSSADWMPRNLFRRIEISFPLLHPKVQAHIEEILDWFWKDNVKARIMDQEGDYHLLPLGPERFNAQQAFLKKAQHRRNVLAREYYQSL